MFNEYEKFMHRALDLAIEAGKENEIPVGAVVVYKGEIIATGKNTKEIQQNATRHAEIAAIESACKALKSWRLLDCELYVTLEPCPMCAGAIINSRISHLIYGTDDTKSGSCGSIVNLFNLPYNHIPKVSKGILKEECAFVLSEFFRKLRKNKT